MKTENFNEKRDTVDEMSLQKKWNSVPLDIQISGADGKKIIVYSRGEWNHCAGPDFLNAKISIDGNIVKGDVEIHRRESDWALHGHSADPAYAGVVLHVCGEKNGTESAPDIPVLMFDAIDKASAKAPPPRMAEYGLCAARFDGMADDALLEFFRDAGKDRLRKRAGTILKDMLENGAGKAFLRRLFDVCGISTCRAAFGELFKNTVMKYPEDVLAGDMFDSVVWGESGLLPKDGLNIPDPDAGKIVKDMWRTWWKERLSPGGGIRWRRGGARPLNTPERRIAGLCATVRRHGLFPLDSWCGKIRNASSLKSAAEYFASAFEAEDTFWDRHSSFDSEALERGAALIGHAKSVEMAVDAALPALYAYAKLKDDGRLCPRILLILASLRQRENDSVTRRALKRFFSEPERVGKLLTDAAAKQGLHHIYREFCAKRASDCDVCVFFNSPLKKN